jgi:hypothetical protein
LDKKKTRQTPGNKKFVQKLFKQKTESCSKSTPPPVIVARRNVAAAIAVGAVAGPDVGPRRERVLVGADVQRVVGAGEAGLGIDRRGRELLVAVDPWLGGGLRLAGHGLDLSFRLVCGLWMVNMRVT